jgi:hypothetical protein
VTDRPRHRPTIRAVATTLIGLVLCGCVANPVPSGPPGVTAIPSAAASIAATRPTPSAGGPSVEPPGAAWTFIGQGDHAASTQYRSVVAMADGFVVIGSAGQAGEVAVALHSTDGQTWTTDQISGRGTSPTQVIPWGDRTIAVGGGQTRRCAHPGSEIDTWVRAADGTWAEAPFAPVLCSGGETAMPLVLGGVPWLTGEGTGDVSFLLESDDGRSWTDRPDRIPDDVYLGGAAVDRTGMWLAGRSVTDDHAVFLASPDGSRFRQIALRDASGAALDAITTVTLGDQLVVLAKAVENDRIVRLTPRGADGWSEVAVTGFPLADVTGIQATGGPLVAFTGHDAGLPGIRASGDGAAWHEVPVPSEITVGAWPTSIAVRNGVAVLVGQLEQPDGNGLIGAIWTAPASILGG